MSQHQHYHGQTFNIYGAPGAGAPTVTRWGNCERFLVRMTKEDPEYKKRREALEHRKAERSKRKERLRCQRELEDEKSDDYSDFEDETDSEGEEEDLPPKRVEVGPILELLRFGGIPPPPKKDTNEIDDDADHSKSNTNRTSPGRANGNRLLTPRRRAQHEEEEEQQKRRRREEAIAAAEEEERQRQRIIILRQLELEKTLRATLFGLKGEDVVRGGLKTWMSEDGENFLVLLPYAEEGDGPLPDAPQPQELTKDEEKHLSPEDRQSRQEQREKRDAYLAQMNLKIRSVADENSKKLEEGVTWSELELFKILATVGANIRLLHSAGYVHGAINANNIEFEEHLADKKKKQKQKQTGAAAGGREGGGSTRGRSKHHHHATSTTSEDDDEGTKYDSDDECGEHDGSEFESKKKPEKVSTYRFTTVAHCVDLSALKKDPTLASSMLGYSDTAQFPSQKPPHLAPELHRWLGYARAWKDDPSQNTFLIQNWQSVDMYQLGVMVLELALGRGASELPSAGSKEWESFLSLRVSNAHGHLNSLLDGLSVRGYSANLQAFLSLMLQMTPCKRPSPEVLQRTMEFLQVEKILRNNKLNGNNQQQKKKPHPPPNRKMKEQKCESKKGKNQDEGEDQTRSESKAGGDNLPDEPPQKFALRSVTKYSTAQRREIRKVLNSAVQGSKGRSGGKDNHTKLRKSKDDGDLPPQLTGVHHKYYLETESAKPFVHDPGSRRNTSLSAHPPTADKGGRKKNAATENKDEMFV